MTFAALAERRMEPEWLDILPPADPRARRSRRDLGLVNSLMGHRGILVRHLRELMGSEAPGRIVELGAGDGTMLLSVARKLAPSWPGLAVQLVDRQDLVQECSHAGFAKLGWRIETVKADLFSWLRTRPGPRADIAIANLVLHHFDAASLRELLALIAKITNRFIAVEPCRSLAALAGSRALGLIGCNDVTRHDAVVSVRAGFRGMELSRLWPDSGEWQRVERPAGLFSHLFMARRADAETARSQR
ncbi:MAG: hypothetical protein HYY48_11495 [Gammaproteobacteria bacterium]|nr:hypothetical protein [Gammaproteobacteria bacterium]